MKLCPYCNESLTDGKHTVDILMICGIKHVAIGCPKHSKGNTITAVNINAIKELVSIKRLICESEEPH